MGVVKKTVEKASEYLEFTYESGEDCTDGWLQTLDTSLKVNEKNKVDYRYYEKPTTTNTTIRKTSAMSENPKVQCLSNDLVRRLLNTREKLPNSYRADVVDRYGTKLLTSGFSKDQTKRILVNGMKGYISKRERRRKLGDGKGGVGRIHHTAEESSHRRIRKKLLSRTSWYKDKRNQEDHETPGGCLGSSKGPRGAGSRPKKGNTPLRTRAVLFLEQTPQGELARRIREQIQILEPTLGYKVRVVERTGRSIKNMFAQTSIWQGLQCDREQCVTCNQGGEDRPDCTRSGVVYESICSKCNPSSLTKGELRSQETKAPSLYVGESH